MGKSSSHTLRATGRMCRAEQWNDWHWQLKNRVTSLAQLEQHLELSDDERNGVLLSGNEARAGRHAAFFQSDRAGQSGLPDSPPGHSAHRRKLDLALRHGRSVRRRFAHAGAGPGASLSGPRPLSRHRPLRELLPLLHPQPRRQRSRRTGTAYRVRGNLPVSRAAHRSARRPAFRRRRACSSATASWRKSSAGCARSRTSSSSASARASRFFCRNASRRSFARCCRNTIRSG